MKRFLAGMVAGVAVLALTGGCSDRQFGPKLALLQAAQNFAAADQAGFTLRAGGRVDDLIAVAKKQSAAAGSSFTAQDATLLRQIYRSSLTIAWDRAGSGDADDKSLVKAVVDGVVGPETRVVGGVTYVRVPVRQLAAKFGVAKDDLAAIRKQLNPKIAGVKALFAGNWVWVSAADLQKLMQSMGAAAQQSDSKQREYEAQLMISAQNLIQSAKVVYAKTDRTHLIVTTTTVKAYREGRRLFAALQQIADKPTADLLGETVGADLEKAPANRPIVIDLWVENGRFKAFEFNFLQFIKGSKGRAGLRVDFFQGRGITAPEHATKLDLNRIIKSMPEGGAEQLVRSRVRVERARVRSALVGR